MFQSVKEGIVVPVEADLVSHTHPAKSESDWERHIVTGVN
jgi:hypothetical protein